MGNEEINTYAVGSLIRVDASGRIDLPFIITDRHKIEGEAYKDLSEIFPLLQEGELVYKVKGNADDIRHITLTVTRFQIVGQVVFKKNRDWYDKDRWRGRLLRLGLV